MRLTPTVALGAVDDDGTSRDGRASHDEGSSGTDAGSTADPGHGCSFAAVNIASPWLLALGLVLGAGRLRRRRTL